MFGAGDSITPLDQASHRFVLFEGTSYLLIVRLYKQVSSGAQAIFHDWTTCCKPVQASVSEYGWPETLISDNGPCYTADAFTSGINAYHFNRITCSSHYPQSNRLVVSMYRL